MAVGRQRLHLDGPELSRLVWGARRSVGNPETDTPKKLARLIDAWLLRHPSRPVLVLGSSRLDRLRALAAAERVEMDRQTWFAIIEASLGHPVP